MENNNKSYTESTVDESNPTVDSLLKDCKYCKSILFKAITLNIFMIIGNGLIILSLFIFKPENFTIELKIIDFLILAITTFNALRSGVTSFNLIKDYIKILVISDVLKSINKNN